MYVGVVTRARNRNKFSLQVLIRHSGNPQVGRINIRVALLNACQLSLAREKTAEMEILLISRVHATL